MRLAARLIQLQGNSRNAYAGQYDNIKEGMQSWRYSRLENGAIS
jgi:hypothetical protein